MKKALITGINGQDGSYLAEHLLSEGYQVHGLVRRASARSFQRLSHLLERIELVTGDLLDQTSLITALREIGVTRLLDAIRMVNPKIRFYQASSSEMYGNVETAPQDEQTKFQPRSPYGVAKLYGHWITVNFRESYGMYAVSGILFNHESPRRGAEFVTRKITLGAARIAAGLQKDLRLGNLEARRDWGFTGDYVRAMRLMLQQPEPKDFVIGTGETHSVKELVELAFAMLGMNWRDHVIVDPSLSRPADVDQLFANPARAKAELGWVPTVSFRDLVKMMVEADLELVARDARRNPEDRRLAPIEPLPVVP
jgi:GDPmannose 4,6-dehydratase